MNTLIYLTVILSFVTGGIFPGIHSAQTLPEGFSYVREINPNIKVELRYAGYHNFTGKPVDGYYSATAAILRTGAATALSDVQDELMKRGLGLLIYDAYRPKRADAAFVAWSLTDDVRAKDEFYPNHNKAELFKFGYIAANTRHTRGAAVDLTIVSLSDGVPLDMGSVFDMFDDVSHFGAAGITAKQHVNRNTLRRIMVKHGFTPYNSEWWHFNYAADVGELCDFDVR